MMKYYSDTFNLVDRLDLLLHFAKFPYHSGDLEKTVFFRLVSCSIVQAYSAWTTTAMDYHGWRNTGTQGRVSTLSQWEEANSREKNTITEFMAKLADSVWEEERQARETCQAQAPKRRRKHQNNP